MSNIQNVNLLQDQLNTHQAKAIANGAATRHLANGLLLNGTLGVMTQTMVEHCTVLENQVLQSGNVPAMSLQANYNSQLMQMTPAEGFVRLNEIYVELSAQVQGLGGIPET